MEYQWIIPIAVGFVVVIVFVVKMASTMPAVHETCPRCRRRELQRGEWNKTPVWWCKSCGVTLDTDQLLNIRGPDSKCVPLGMLACRPPNMKQSDGSEMLRPSGIFRTEDEYQNEIAELQARDRTWNAAIGGGR
jgi:hypothetical protein